MGRDHLGQFNVSSALGFARGVLLLDDCEGVSQWYAEGTDATIAVTFDAAATFIGSKGLLVNSGNTDPGAGDYVVAKRMIELPESGLLVFRAKCRAPDWTKIGAVSFAVQFQIASVQYNATIRYTPSTPAGTYFDAAGNPIDVPAWAVTFNNTQWITFELVVDTNNHQYVSGTIGRNKVSLAGIGLYTPGAGTYEIAWLCLQHTNAGAAQSFMHYDNVYAGEFLDI